MERKCSSRENLNSFLHFVNRLAVRVDSGRLISKNEHPTVKQRVASKQKYIWQSEENCSSWVLELYCGLAFICKTTLGRLQRARGVWIKPALSAGVCLTSASRGSLCSKVSLLQLLLRLSPVFVQDWDCLQFTDRIEVYLLPVHQLALRQDL